MSLLTRIQNIVKIGLELAKLQSQVALFNQMFSKNGNVALTYLCGSLLQHSCNDTFTLICEIYENILTSPFNLLL